MFKKAAVVIVMPAICFSGVSCAQKNGYKTAEELGLEDWLYENIYYGCLDRAKARDSAYNNGSGPARKCDVLIFTGNFPRDAGIYYDKDLRLYVTGSMPMDEDAGEGAFQYYILFINSDFNNFLPQG